MSLRHALHAEWTKLRTVSGPAWLLLGLAALTIAVSAAAVGATHCPQNLTCPVDTDQAQPDRRSSSARPWSRSWPC